MKASLIMLPRSLLFLERDDDDVEKTYKRAQEPGPEGVYLKTPA